jgi:uncharacterized damage-inducible protein DinB
MIDPSYVSTMAAYNRWQNDQLLTAADAFDDAQRKADGGAFFASIHATLNHILWGDQVWMSRLTGSANPSAKSIAESVAQYESWEEFKAARRAFDRVLIEWASGLDRSALEGELSWFSGSTRREVRRPRWLLVTHLFNHQTHHRGQVHTLLTALGAKLGATDLPFMPVP